MWEVSFKSLLSILRFVGLATNLVVFKKLPLQNGTLDYEKGLSMKNKSNANMSLFPIATLSQKSVPPINKSQIVAKARSIAKTFIVENICHGLLPPPLEVKIIGLYVLLLRKNIVMDIK
jgi:hypothetical protein